VNAFRRGRSLDPTPKHRERLDGMLGIVVVPGHISNPEM
jgi:hypothetical protein